MNRPLLGKKIVLGVCGSIAAYKACELCSLLVKAGADVYVVMTKSAAKFVGKESFHTLSGHPVAINTFDIVDETKVNHIYLAEHADLFVVAPASANTLAKMSAGIADNMLSDVYLAATCPTLIAPAMNTNMWFHPATQQNIKLLKERGAIFCGPIRGNLACRTEGIGKFKEPAEILNDIVHVIERRQPLLKKVLITAGASIEDIDPVRFISNRSTGKMGHALAEVCALRGADVTLLSSSTLPPPSNCRVLPFRSSSELYQLVTTNYATHDIIIQAAAPADYTVEQYSTSKIKKTDDDLVLKLIRTKDIAASIGKNKKSDQIFVGFAAETDKGLEHAQEKRKKKNLDLIVLNNVTQQGAGFAADTNIATLITRDSVKELEIMSKFDLANIIVDKILELISEEI